MRRPFCLTASCDALPLSHALCIGCGKGVAIMWEVAVAFLTDNAVALGGGAAVLAIIETTVSPFRNLARRFRKPEPVVIANPEAFLPKAVTAPQGIQMDVDTFTALQSKLRDDARAELSTAHGAERRQLEEKIEALNARLANPDEALAQQHAIILDLEAKLARRGNDLGGDNVATAKAALEAGDFTAARALFETLAARTAPDVHAHADASFALGQIAEAEVRWGDAADHFTKAARMNPTFETLVKSGHYLWRAGRHAEAIVQEEQLVTLARKEFGPEEQRTAVAINNLAGSYCSSRQFVKAEPLFREALEIARKTIGVVHPSYATHVNNLAVLLKETGRPFDAEPLFREALEIDRNTLGKAHPNYAVDLNNLASLLQDTERLAEAEPLYREALEIGRDTVGTAHPDFATRLSNLAGLLELTGQLAEAESLYRMAVVINRKALGNGHPATRVVAGNFIDLLTNTSGDPAEIAELSAILIA
jgi:tetratricopeptide (TPR) repeat protein